MRGLIVILAVLGCANLSAAIVSRQSSDTVLGQADFTSNANPATPTARSMNGPYGVAVDPTTGKIFVSDTENNRVLRYASSAALTAGTPAEAVLGQPDFVSNGHGTTATSMYFPGGLAVDGYGTLWVGDIQNNRVLRFANASAKASGAAADGVLGQTDFVTSTFSFPPTQSSITSAYALAANSAGTLWVTDTNESRVLRFDYASAKPNGANADAVLGQVDFVTTVNPAPPTAASMDGPIGLTVDAADNLWVADSNNNRVLRFNHATLKTAMGASADAVLGQPTFGTTFISTTRYGLFSPSGVGVDSSGNLWISTYYDNRVLGYANGATTANGALADVVLGQPAFDISIRYVPPRAYSVAGSRQIAGDAAGNIWLVDGGNSRVLRFSPIQATPTPAPVPAPAGGSAPPIVIFPGSRQITTSQSSVSLRGSASGSAGVIAVQYRVGGGAFRTARGTTSWSFRAKLKPGKNAITVRAVDTQDRTSTLVKIAVNRK